MNKVIRCACGSLSVIPASSPVCVCRACYGKIVKARRVEAEKTATAAAAAAAEALRLEALRKQKAEAEALKVALKEGYLKGTLPSGAKVLEQGRMIVVSYEGTSVTFCLPKMKKAA